MAFDPKTITVKEYDELSDNLMRLVEQGTYGDGTVAMNCNGCERVFEENETLETVLDHVIPCQSVLVKNSIESAKENS
jgi:hypothetical protein